MLLLELSPATLLHISSPICDWFASDIKGGVNDLIYCTSVKSREKQVKTRTVKIKQQKAEISSLLVPKYGASSKKNAGAYISHNAAFIRPSLPNCIFQTAHLQFVTESSGYKFGVLKPKPTYPPYTTYHQVESCA